jgi:hypothetical protein
MGKVIAMASMSLDGYIAKDDNPSAGCSTGSRTGRRAARRAGVHPDRPRFLTGSWTGLSGDELMCHLGHRDIAARCHVPQLRCSIRLVTSQDVHQDALGLV